jgi:ABC-type bacteriocin/lantibiotic exporter with double-glycine peptidase domain
LSGGQVQILALARAILAKNKIVILDEGGLPVVFDVLWLTPLQATAAMDASTSAIIHNVIKHRFRNHTVITITHNIHSAVSFSFS